MEKYSKPNNRKEHTPTKKTSDNINKKPITTRILATKAKSSEENRFMFECLGGSGLAD